MHDLYVDFGDTYLDTDGILKKFALTQTFNFLKYTIMDAINRFGKSIYNYVLPEYFSELTGDMRHQFNMSIP